MLITYFRTMNSPLGPLLLTSDGSALTGLFMNSGPHAVSPRSEWQEDPTALPFPETERQLAAYFAGERTEFDVPLRPEGTPFQQSVWAELRCIPYGTTLSYGELARRLGNANASRAVGLANGRNPISILVPCHRVIGAGGKLVGYGGGLANKQFLLSHEAGEQKQGGELELPFDSEAGC